MQPSYLGGENLRDEEEEENEEFTDFSISSGFKMRDIDIETRETQRNANIYENIISSAVDNLEGSFRVEDVRNEIRSPYSLEEVEGALEYAVEEGELTREDELYVSK